MADKSTFLESGMVEPGDSGSSHLVELLTGDGSDRPAMPKSGPPLSAEQVALIKRWIDEGANWPDGVALHPDSTVSYDWWSLNRLKRPEPPVFTESANSKEANAWIKTPIDAFIFRRLLEHKLMPAPHADRRTLIRRVTYDLTGLPPTFEQIREFVGDPDENAYEKLVDKLLDSPRYGERWARHWLDVVKYADTCGYDKDKIRTNAWPYRDYVIRSLNQDKPYAQFVQEQIAGDALFPGQPDGILGLGFIAAGPWDFIGHVEVPESKLDGQVARNLDRDDMVSNALNTFCSLTVQCARCHDHKFDPISQEDYYSLQAIFAAVDRADRVYDADPQVAIQRDKIETKIQSCEDQLAKLEIEIASQAGPELAKLNQQIEQLKTEPKSPEFGFHSQIAARPDQEKWVELRWEQARPISQIVLHACHDEFAGIGAGFGFPKRFRVEVDGIVVFDRTQQDFENPALKPVSIPVEGFANRIRIEVTQLAARSNDYIFALAEMEVLDAEGTNQALDAIVDASDSVEAPVRWRQSNLVDGIWFQGSHEAKRTELAAERDALIARRVTKSSIDRQHALRELLTESQTTLAELPSGKLVYAATTRFPTNGNFRSTEGIPREIRLLDRGNVENPGSVVPPALLPLNQQEQTNRGGRSIDASVSESERRAALAIWLTAPDHPLTWRSIVNRVWHYHFGRGIVDTPNDFGRMGGVRSHPELLDWLAVEFRDRGGSLKDLHRMIVTSSVYQQASIAEASGGGNTHPNSTIQRAAEVDATNKLLWKMNRRRLSAEEIRDSILMVSGQLNLKMGGPGFYLFDLEKTEHSPHFEYHSFNHSDSASYRRSIYRFIVRSQPDPFMTTLDCADSSQSTPTRNETQTPLQSLTMLHSPFNAVMAEVIAQRVREASTDASSLDEQIRTAVRIVLSRDPTDEERVLLTGYARQHGLENLSRMLFNLSEFIYVD